MAHTHKLGYHHVFASVAKIVTFNYIFNFKICYCQLSSSATVALCRWGDVVFKVCQAAAGPFSHLTKKGPFLPQNSLNLSGYEYKKVLEIFHREVDPCWLNSVVWLSSFRIFSSTFIPANIQFHSISKTLFWGWDLGNEQRSTVMFL